MALFNRPDSYGPRRISQFQSLFSWMALFNLNRMFFHEVNEEMVSILVFMDGPLQQSAWLCMYSPYLVSILVFMDGPLQLHPLPFARSVPRRFQSLFSWMALFNPDDDQFTIVTKSCFNPCFHGWPSSTLSFFPPSQSLSCFNPCFHGWPSSTWNVKGRLEKHGAFQSLFSWMALFNKPKK